MAVHAGTFISAQCFWLISALHLNFTNCENAGDSGPVSPLARSSGLGLDSPPCTAAWKLSADSELGQELHSYYKLKQTQCLTPVWDRWYILRRAMKLQGPPIQGHIVSNPVTKDLFLPTLKRGMKTVRTSLLLYFLREEDRKKMLVEYAPAVRYVFHLPLTESTLSPEYTWGRCYHLPCPLHIPEASTTLYLDLCTHLRQVPQFTPCSLHTPEPGIAVPIPQVRPLRSLSGVHPDLRATERRRLSGLPSRGSCSLLQLLQHWGEDRALGRRQGPRAQSPPHTRLLPRGFLPLLSHAGLREQVPRSSGPWWAPRSFLMPNWDIKQGT